MAKRKGFVPEVEKAITASAQKYGLNPQALRAFARIESSGNPKVQTGSYKGLFQLSDGEFRRYGGRGDIFDPAANADAAGAKLAAETQRLEKRLGRTPTAGDVYLVHQQGEGGALEHRRNPDRPAWQSMYATAEGQKKGEKWSKLAIWGNIPHSERKQFGSVENVTSRDFMKLWNDKVARFGEAKSITELAMKGGGGPTTQVAETEIPLPQQKPIQQAAVSPEGLEPGASAGAAHGTMDTPQQVIAQQAPDMMGPLGPVPTPGAGQQVTAEAQPILPVPAQTETSIAGGLGGGGGVFGGGGGFGSLGQLFGLDGKKGGGGGGFKPPPGPPDMGNTYASFASMESSMGASSDDILPTNIPPPPGPPPRTPAGVPVGEWIKKRKRSQVG